MGNKITGDCCQQQPTGSDQIHQRQLQWFVHQVNYHTNYSVLIGTSNKNAKENMDQTDNLKGQQFDLEQATTNATDRKSLKNVT